MARIRQWLILLSRIAALSTLITAAARPVAGRWLGWGFSGTPDTVIILLDRSATMGNSFSEGKSTLDRSLEMLAAAGKTSAPDAAAVLIDSASLACRELPSWDVLPELSRTKITGTEADLPAMFRTALAYITENNTGRTEIWTASDMQRSNWKPADAEWHSLDEAFASLKQPVRFRVLAVKNGKKQDRSATLVKLAEYAGGGTGITREIIFRINSAGKTASAKELPLVICEGSSRQQFTVNVNGPQTRIRHSLADSDGDKMTFGYIELPPDANRLNNSFFFAFDKLHEEKTVVASENSSLAALLSAAAAPEGEKMKQKAESVNTSRLKSANFADTALVIYQGQLKKQEFELLKNFAESGGCVLCLPPSGNALKSTESIWTESKDLTKDKSVTVGEWEHRSGPLADSITGEALPVDEIAVARRALLNNTDALPVALCTDGKPFLYAEKTGKGIIYYCTTLPLRTWSNLGDGAVLVPMLRRMAKQGAARFSVLKFSYCGKDHDIPADCEVVNTAGTEKDTEVSPAVYPGIYKKDNRYYIVNRPPGEDVTGSLGDNELKSLFRLQKIMLFNETGSGNEKMQAEIWRIFIYVLLAALVLEAFLCRTPRQKKKAL